MATKTQTYTCDSCGAEADGYTQAELLRRGWCFHSLTGKRRFIMCGDCEHTYAVRRAVRTATTTDAP